MTTTVTSAADLVTDPEFLGFCLVWEAEHRAPFPFGDWLRDHDLWRQGEVADWAYAAPDLPNPHRPKSYEDWPSQGGPTPYFHSDRLCGWWLRTRDDDKRKETDDLEESRSPGIKGNWEYPSFAAAVVALLDNYTVPK